MSNQNNSNNEQIEQLLQTLSEHLCTDTTKIKEAVQNNNFSEALKNLDSSDSQKLQKILSNKALSSKILSSSKAQQLMKDFMGENK